MIFQKWCETCNSSMFHYQENLNGCSITSHPCLCMVWIAVIMIKHTIPFIIIFFIIHILLRPLLDIDLLKAFPFLYIAMQFVLTLFVSSVPLVSGRLRLRLSARGHHSRILLCYLASFIFTISISILSLLFVPEYLHTRFPIISQFRTLILRLMPTFEHSGLTSVRHK